MFVELRDGPLLIKRPWRLNFWGSNYDAAGGDALEFGGEFHQVQVAVDPPRLPAGLVQAGGAPAQRHPPVSPALDVAGVVAADPDHGLDRVGRAQRAGQGWRHPEPEHGQRLTEAFAQAAGGIGPGLVQLPDQRLELGLGIELGAGAA